MRKRCQEWIRSTGSGGSGFKTGSLQNYPSCDTCGSGGGGATLMSTGDKKIQTQSLVVTKAPPSPEPVSPYGFKLDVDVTHQSTISWKSNTTGTGLQLWYRWYTDDGVVLFEGPGTDYFPTTLKSGQTKIIPVTVEPPCT